jgi:hypothetical protein
MAFGRVFHLPVDQFTRIHLARHVRMTDQAHFSQAGIQWLMAIAAFLLKIRMCIESLECHPIYLLLGHRTWTECQTAVFPQGNTQSNQQQDCQYDTGARCQRIWTIYHSNSRKYIPKKTNIDELKIKKMDREEYPKLLSRLSLPHPSFMVKYAYAC